MTTSNSVDFSVSRNDIITASLQEIGQYRTGQTISADDVTLVALRLNMVSKQWQGTADFAPGLKEWSRKRGYVFLQTSQASYSLGPSGDNATSSYSRTTISTDEASAQTVLSVTSTTGMTAADIIGIELDSGALHWTTIVSTGAGPTVTITTQLPSAAAAGNYVYWYTTKMRQPLHIITASLRDENTKDSPLRIMRTLEEYESIPDKTADSDPSSLYYEFQLTNGVMYLDAEPTDVTKVIRLTFLSAIEDFDAANDTPDYPQVWYLPLVLQTAKLIAPVYGIKWTQDQEDNRKEAIAIARNTLPEVCDLYFQSG